MDGQVCFIFIQFDVGHRDTDLLVSCINLSVGCEILDCNSVEAAACCGPV